MTPGPCPPGLFVGVFTIAAVDNIDHNPSSTTASDSFHGTAISLTQHRTSELEGTQISRGAFDMADSCKTIKPLSSSFTTVAPSLLYLNILLFHH